MVSFSINLKICWRKLFFSDTFSIEKCKNDTITTVVFIINVIRNGEIRIQFCTNGSVQNPGFREQVFSSNEKNRKFYFQKSVFTTSLLKTIQFNSIQFNFICNQCIAF